MSEIKINIPENWSEVKLPQYLAFYKAIKPYEGTDEYERVIFERAILHFCGISSNILYNLNVEILKEIKQTISAFLADGMKQPLVTKFKLNDTEYGFIPSLDDMSYGEYLDLISYTKDIWAYTPLLMSILYRPINAETGDKYTIETYNGTNDDRVALFKDHLTMDVVWGAIAFFLDLQIDLVKDTLTYLNKEMMDNMTEKEIFQANTILKENGLDITQLQSYLKTTSSTLMQLQDSQFTSV